MKQSLYNRAVAVEALPLGTIDDDTTTAGTAIDLNVFNNKFRDSVLFQVITGVITDGSYAVTAEESEDGVTYTEVPDKRIQGTKPAITATSDGALFQFGVQPGNGRYLRLSVTSTGITDGGVIGAVAVLYGGSNTPVKRS